MQEPQKVKERFGLHLRSLREKRDLSLRELATLAGIHHSKIGLMELGKTNLTLTSIFALANGLEVEPRELLDFKI